MSAIKTKKTPVRVLQELTTKSNSNSPIYELRQNQDTPENGFVYEVHVMGVSAIGRGISKKEAKHITAKIALTKLQEERNIKIEDDFSFEPRNVLTLDEANDDPKAKPIVNYIGKLADFCFQHNIEAPEFVEISAVGSLHAMRFTSECHIGDSLTTTATENRKKLAKQVCAKQMLDHLKNIYPEVSKEHEDNLRVCDRTTKAIEVYHESQLQGLNLGHKVNGIDMKLLDSLVGQESMMEDEDSYKDSFNPSLDEEKFNLILKNKNLSACFEDLTDDGPTKIIALEVVGDRVFSTLGIGETIDIAKKMALEKMFKVLTTFLDI